MYKKYKKLIEETKFILPIMLVLPPVLGGIWQLVELYRIDPAYIRFFSATQLLPDGLLMLIILLALVPTLLMLLMLNKIIPDGMDNVLKNKRIKFTTKSTLKHQYVMKNKQGKLKHINKCLDYGNSNFISMFIFLMLIELLLVRSLYSDIKEDEIYLFSFLIKIFSSSLILAIITTILLDARGCCQSKLIKKVINNKIFLKLSGVIYFAFTIIFDFIAVFLIPYLIIASLHKVYLFPYNLVNASRLNNKIEKKYSLKELLYLNDKYIFMELSDGNQSKQKTVQVIKFDTLF